MTRRGACRLLRRLALAACGLLAALSFWAAGASAATASGPGAGSPPAGSVAASSWTALSPAQRAAEVRSAAVQLHPTSCTPDLSAANCPTEEAAAFRARIAGLLAAGLTPRQVVARFLNEYGPQVRFLPPSRGAAVLIWVLPFAGVLGGAFVWWRFVRGAGRRAGGTTFGDAGPAPAAGAVGGSAGWRNGLVGAEAPGPPPGPLPGPPPGPLPGPPPGPLPGPPPEGEGHPAAASIDADLRDYL